MVDPATPPDAPASPRVLLNTLLAALVGLLLALGIAFTMEYLDDTVKSSEDVEAATGLATLGTVLKMKGGKGPQRDLPPGHAPLPARAGRGGLPDAPHEPGVRLG